MSNLREESVNVITIFGGSLKMFVSLFVTQISDSAHLKEIHAVPVGKLLPHVPRYLVVVSVDLVPHEDPEHLGRRVLLDLPQPVRATVKCWLICDVINQDKSVG